MSLRPPTIHAVDPATLEDSSVAFYLALTQLAKSVDGQRLLFAGMDWEKLFSSANPPGAPTPKVAKATYTRLALRQHHQRRQALRSGSAGLRKAIHAAA